MKKTIGSYYSQYFRMPCLYREDLEAIEAIIREELKPAKYHVAFEGCEYESVQDVAGDQAEVHTLVVYTQDPSLRLKFARSWAELYAGESGPALDSAIRKIGQVVAATERHWVWAFSKFSAWAAPLLGFGCVAILSELFALGTPARSLYSVLTLLLLTAVWWVLGYRNVFYRFSCLDLRKKRPRQGMFARNRSQILFAAVGALLGFLGGLLLR
jgi:hypothetical protein